MRYIGGEGAVFHTGEIAAQTRAGVGMGFEAMESRFIRPFFLQQHRDFYTQLPFIVMSACDKSGRPWVGLLTGEPGFISAGDELHLSFDSQVAKGDALEGALTEGSSVGLIGIEFDTKRRNRANGVLSRVTSSTIEFSVKHSYGNCPQYISSRAGKLLPKRDGAKVERRQSLNVEMKEWIGRADSLFIGSSNSQINLHRRAGEEAGKGGVEMGASHRGGEPGFVTVVDDNRLILPDYRGNNFFNTIGNILLNPRIGLLLVDFKNGNQLQITARAKIDWNLPDQKAFCGAQRLIIIDVEEIVALSFDD